MSSLCECKWVVAEEFEEGSLYIQDDHLHGLSRKLLVRDVTNIICDFPGHALSIAS